MERTRTRAYRATIMLADGKPASDIDQYFLDEAKADARAIGRFLGKSFYVKMQGRLGKNNPYAYKYRRGNKFRYTHQAIRLADAAYADIYIYERY